MVCKKFFDIKKVAYDVQVYDNYMSAISTSGFQELLINKDGLTLDTKGEVAEFTVLNGVRYVDSERTPLRQTGSLKFSKNFDSSLIDNHSMLIDAGLGRIDLPLSVVVTGGTGASGTPFLTTSTANIISGSMVNIPGVGYRVVNTLVPNTSFTTTVVIPAAITASTTFAAGPYLNAVVVTAGKGSVAIPFLTSSTSGIFVGCIVAIPAIGNRIVISIIANTSFVVDIPLETTISTPTAFSKTIMLDITNPIGNCVNTFNFVLELDNGEAIKLMGCGVQCEFTPVYEKQMTISFTITSPDITELSAAPTGFSTATAETKGTPVICNFTTSYIVTAGTAESYFPVNFDLGFSTTSEPIKAIGGRNNILGYQNRASIKSKITLDRIAKCLVWVNNPRVAREYYFYQSNFAIIIQKGLLTLTDRSIANGNHESISCEMDNNIDADYRVFLMLP